MKKSGNAMGISLILVVFILLCLITFGTLSYMLAKIDNNLSISAADNIIEYYEGDMEAQEHLQTIDGILMGAYSTASSLSEYLANVEAAMESETDIEFVLDEEEMYLTFYTQVSDKEELVSTIEIVYPVQEGYYRIDSWLLVNNSGE